MGHRMSAQRVDKWVRWIEGPIKHNVLSMHLQRKVWNEATEMLAANPDLPHSYWWEFMRETYSTTMAMAVRRQVDLDKQVASLARLVTEIESDAELLTLDRYLTVTTEDDDPSWFDAARRTWDERFGGTFSHHLDPTVPGHHRRELAEMGATVRRYVDKHVAHAEASAPEVVLTVNELHAGVDVIGRIFNTYVLLLTGASYGRLDPVIQHTWQEAFWVPWSAPGWRRKARQRELERRSDS